MKGLFKGAIGCCLFCHWPWYFLSDYCGSAVWDFRIGRTRRYRNAD